jgi:uncharacterized membrane protein YraQ (UPF0718 family)
MAILFPRELEVEARDRAEAITEGCQHHEHMHAADASAKWTRLATAFWMDWRMLWKEIIGGFLVAGFIAALVPVDWWKALFLESGPWWLRLIENAIVGPFIAVASFVCSVGNIPLASLLWSNGISFGGVISFIYADLIVVPIILIYGKYFGARAAIYITTIFYVAMVLSGVIIDLAFDALGLIPNGARPESAIAHAAFNWDSTSCLDFAALALAAWFLYLSVRGRRALHSH